MGYPQLTFTDGVFNLRVFLGGIGAPDVTTLLSPAEAASQMADVCAFPSRRLCRELVNMQALKPAAQQWSSRFGVTP